MEWIDKEKNAPEGTKVIDEFLELNWVEDDSMFANINYSDFNNNRFPFRAQIIDILLKNQSDFCCYCMKSITKNLTTIEHIIPQSEIGENLELYFEGSELVKKICLKHEFNKTQKILPPTKYPHDIAYHNMLASCKSTNSCNHYRGNDPIKPLALDKKILEKVEYDSKGRAYSEEYEDELSYLGLSQHHSILATIRRIWYELSTKISTIDEINDDIIDDILSVLKLENDRILENFTGNPSYRSEIRNYHWFFSYFKQESEIYEK